ncbi:MAG: hypothetical protein LBL99_01515 [Holosporaceae bacterium]|jgi:hypothetical protein|nr:hypothetical protein [Holosporaceae bacterium]
MRKSLAFIVGVLCCSAGSYGMQAQEAVQDALIQSARQFFSVQTSPSSATALFKACATAYLDIAITQQWDLDLNFELFASLGIKPSPHIVVTLASRGQVELMKRLHLPEAGHTEEAVEAFIKAAFREDIPTINYLRETCDATTRDTALAKVLQIQEDNKASNRQLYTACEFAAHLLLKFK